MDPEITELLRDIDTEELDEWDGEIPSSKCSNCSRLEISQHQKGSTSTPDPCSKSTPSTSSSQSTPSTSRSQQQKTKKRSASQARFNPNLDKETVLNCAGDIVKAALQKSVTEPRFGIESGYGGEVKHLAQRILEEIHVSEEQFSDFSTKLVTDILGTVEAGQGALTSAGSDLVWTAFHKVRISEEVKGKWESFLLLLRVGGGGKPMVKNLLHQYLLRTVLGEVVINQCMKSTRKEQASVVTPSHSDHDMQVLRYIAGFVPFSLLNKYKREKSEQARNYVTLLKQWQINDESTTFAPSFLSYTVTWLNLQNRGGLFKVNDDVFRFFFALEKISKKIMIKSNLKNLNSGINNILKDKIIASPEVITMWEKITSSCSFQTKNLFNAVVQKWTKLRVNAFVKAYNIIKKQEKQASKKGEKSLRKELSK